MDLEQDHPLRTWRRAQGISLEALASRVNCTPSHLSQIERGIRSLSLELAHRLSEETGREVTLEAFAEAAE